MITRSRDIGPFIEAGHSFTEVAVFQGQSGDDRPRPIFKVIGQEHENFAQTVLRDNVRPGKVD